MKIMRYSTVTFFIFSYLLICSFSIRAENIPPPPKINVSEIYRQFEILISYDVSIDVDKCTKLVRENIGQPYEDYEFPIKITVTNLSFTNCYMSIEAKNIDFGNKTVLFPETSIGSKNIENLRKTGKTSFIQSINLPNEGQYQLIFDVKCYYGNIFLGDQKFKLIRIVSPIYYNELKNQEDELNILKTTNWALIIITGISIIATISSPYLSSRFSRKHEEKVIKSLEKITSAIKELKKDSKKRIT